MQQINLQAKGTGYIYLRTNNTDSVAISAAGATIQNGLEILATNSAKKN